MSLSPFDSSSSSIFLIFCLYLPLLKASKLVQYWLSAVSAIAATYLPSISTLRVIRIKWLQKSCCQSVCLASTSFWVQTHVSPANHAAKPGLSPQDMTSCIMFPWWDIILEVGRGEHCPIVHETERTLSPAGRSVSRTASDAHKPALDVVCEAFP